MTTSTSTPNPTTTHAGGCHCGAIRFEAEVDLTAPAGMCNCTVCTKVAQVGAIVRPSAFRLVSGAEHLSTYEWGGRISQRKFCKHCGIHCFAPGHLAELGGDYVSINLNCLDGFDRAAVSIRHWDGRHNNWEAGPRATPWPVAP
ncbi:MAG TPA: GFA family protein [Kofleriaceae bacterium]|nr:GFA family protein [Kofleriaceae bacterium]